jgi:acetoin utilization protein AcuB
MDDEKLVGIITTNDVMGVLLHAIGIDRESTRMSVLAEDRIGYLAELTHTLKEQQINIRSVFSWPEKQFPGLHRLVFRVPAIDGEKAAMALKKNGFKVITEYHSDLTPFLPDR